MKKSILFLFLCSGSLFGQLSDQQFITTYKEGVTFFEEQKYDEAYTKLSTLTSKNHNNAVAPYAYLYGALAAEKKGNKYQAKILYRSLMQFYPTWDKINDAKILYAQNNFSEGYFEEGLKILHEIDDENYKSLKLNLISEYIPNVKTVTALKNLYNKYPNYRPIAKALVDKIQKNRYNSKADLELSDMLTNRFDLLGNEKPAASQNTGKKKPSKTKSAKQLNFGVLLPFETSGADAQNSSNRYIYDIYAGMIAAADKLNSDGANIAIHTYDIKTDAQAFKNAEKKAGFKKLDLIVGPLYPAPNNLAQTFINENNTLQVHPISNNLTLLSTSKNAFLMQPSHMQQSKKSLDYALNSGSGKSVSIYFGDARKDSLFADIYAAEAKKRGFTINEKKRFRDDKLKPEKGHIFYAGDNNSGVKFLQAVAMNNITCEVLLTASSFNWDKLNTSVFTEKTALIYPEFVNREKEAVKEFEKSYFAKNFAAPSYYSHLGYDLVYYFGSMLKDGRDLFKMNIELGEYVENYMLGGYDFSNKIKQNEIVPIIKYRYNNFEEVYR